MTKINQIQNALRELADGAFQKLADAYLHKNGYERLNPLGSVIGADKVRKGTPDTSVALADGRFVFAEYTTQKDGVYKKLMNDLLKCLDEAKTGVPLPSIAEIVFCHTSTLRPDEESALAEECQKRGVNLSLFGIGSISFDLYQHYPGLAKDFLGIEIDTGQVLSAEDFVDAYNKSKLAAPLDTRFHFREKELSDILTGLEHSDLVIVSGKAGVGKSRLALESCYRFATSHPEYLTRCIFNRGPDLFQDLKVHFSEAKHFLILVDDANRQNRFEYFIQLLQEQCADRKIKVIATVRDYALDSIRTKSRPYGGGAEIQVPTFTDEQIKKLVEDEYEIRNQHYQVRIADIARGNPRLAVMAAKVARDKNTLESIRDVTSLYDEYYASIRDDLQNLDNPDVLKCAGITAFLRVVDRTAVDTASVIEVAFGVPPEGFWAAMQTLHNLEMVDLYEDSSIVRTSDQVLATYLFYLAVFKERVLSFSALLTHFFSRIPQRLIDALNPVLNTFDGRAIAEMMRPDVDRYWEDLSTAHDDEAVLHLMEIFWFVNETRTLVEIQKRISALEPDAAESSDREFVSACPVPSPSILSVLRSFRYSNEQKLRNATSLMLDYLAKRPKHLLAVAQVLSRDFGFDPKSYLYDFVVQRAVVETLSERTRQGGDFLYSTLFLKVAEQYLHIQFEVSESKDRRSFSWGHFDLSPSPRVLELRRTIWARVFEIYENPLLRAGVFGLLSNYSRSGFLIGVNEIVAEDAKEVLPFFERRLSPSNYRDCLMVQEYLDCLDAHNITPGISLKDRFTNDTYKTSRLLLENRRDWAEMSLSYDRYQQLKKERIKESFSGHVFQDYASFLNRCLEIKAELTENHENFMFTVAVGEALLIAAERDRDLYPKLIEHYLKMGDPIDIPDPALVVQALTRICGPDNSYEIIQAGAQNSSRKRWLFAFYRSLKEEQITAEHARDLYDLYRTADRKDLPYDSSFLTNFRRVDQKAFETVCEIILEKSEADSACVFPLFLLLIPQTKINKSALDLLNGNLELFKRCYFAVLRQDKGKDYDGQTFSGILDRDQHFIIEYIDRQYVGEERPDWHEDGHDYTFLWCRSDYRTVMNLVVERIYENERKRPYASSRYLRVFFTIGHRGEDKPANRQQQDEVLVVLIQDRYSDRDFMSFIFELLVELPPERRGRLIGAYLQRNNNFEDFKILPLEPGHWGWSGSAVPLHESRVSFLNSLLPYVGTVEFLQHRLLIENQIQKLRQAIEYEKKRDFIDD